MSHSLRRDDHSIRHRLPGPSPSSSRINRRDQLDVLGEDDPVGKRRVYTSRMSVVCACMQRWNRRATPTTTIVVGDARYHTMMMAMMTDVSYDEDKTAAGTTDDTTVSNARLDVGIWSVGEGATQQQSGGVVLAAGASARPIFETRVELHQHENLPIQRHRLTLSEVRVG